MLCCNKNSFCLGMALAGVIIGATAILVNHSSKKREFKREYINKDIYDNEEYQKQQILEEKYQKDPELREKVNQFNSRRLYNDDEYIE